MPDAAREFVARFTDFWTAPSVSRIPEILHEDAVLLQPLASPMHGMGAIRREFEGLFALVPDLRAVVDSWRGDPDELFVSIRLYGHIGARPVEWPAVDRFRLVGDKAAIRISYFDPLPLLPAILYQPAVWLPWWRSGVARPWRSPGRFTNLLPA
ncbi:nuclear transport factor 2 family protein [Mycobacteroides saopaulense]|uniref:nuclear transport factor 2 family protein n=1 Tax=Mycobacteroides saopaulense TaxID=1578165 RepID=UPI000B4DC4AD|nr:nuclear transport factor 2 family protein [Mycobacteroides saopaulense]